MIETQNDHDHLAAGDVSLLSATVLPPLGCIGLCTPVMGMSLWG